MSKPEFHFNFDVKKKLESIVSITTYVPENSYTGDLLGTERTGHGIVIGDDDLIITIGYIITEADSIWITSHDKEAVPAYVIANDYESGLGLVKPVIPLGLQKIACGTLEQLNTGSPVLIAGFGGLGYMLESYVTDIREFTGRWEYIQDNAIFTSPVHPNWAGAALIGEEGKLHGIGCLLVQNEESSDLVDGQNMFVPVDSITPDLAEIQRHGARLSSPRPWLGLLVQEEDHALVVTGLFSGCPAEKADVRLADKILAVNEKPVYSLAELFRSVWAVGSVGILVHLTILRGDKKLILSIHSSDRDTAFRRGSVN